MIPRKVVIRGAGDLATGVAHRLKNSGFKIIMLELEKPLVVRSTVSFATALYKGSIVVENVRAELCPKPELIEQYLAQNILPVLVDPEAELLKLHQAPILIDAIMSKHNTLTTIDQANLVIGLGPGFIAGKDVHAVVETQRGHNLGRVLHSGSAEKDTASPAVIAGYGRERLLRAPASGVFKPLKEIGSLVKAGDPVARVGNTDIYSEIDGMVRGMLHQDLDVCAGMKVGDIDPRGSEVNCYAISDKARAIGGGVLEAIMNRYFYQV